MHLSRLNILQSFSPELSSSSDDDRPTQQHNWWWREIQEEEIFRKNQGSKSHHRHIQGGRMDRKQSLVSALYFIDKNCSCSSIRGYTITEKLTDWMEGQTEVKEQLLRLSHMVSGWRLTTCLELEISFLGFEKDRRWCDVEYLFKSPFLLPFDLFSWYSTYSLLSSFLPTDMHHLIGKYVQLKVPSWCIPFFVKDRCRSLRNSSWKGKKRRS